MRPAIPAVLILPCGLPASAADSPASVIRVSATYPGADARTLDETVLTELYRQINGVEGMTRIETEARNDGAGVVTVYFHPRADMNLAEVRVQNRVNLALHTIPEPCRQLGIAVRKVPAGPPQFWLALTSADETHDAKFLVNYAMLYLKNEFSYNLGVTDVRVVGVGEFAMHVWLTTNKLAVYKLTAGDVIDALRRQNAQVGAGGTLNGKALQYNVTASGRLTKPEEFGNVILQANADGEVLRLRDVARVEMGAAQGGFTRVDGKPSALIAVTAWSGRVTADQFRKAEGVDDLPPGMRFDVVADRAIDRLLSVEVRLPHSATLERTEEIVAKATDLIRGLPGKPGAFALGEDRAPNMAMIFVKVRAKGGPTAADVEKALAGIAEAAIRVGDVPPGEEAFPARIALLDPNEFRDPGERGEERFREDADRVVARLLRDKAVAAPATFPGPAAPRLAVDVDRDKCAQCGVEINDVFTTLQVALGGVYATDFQKFGRKWQVRVRAEPYLARNMDDLNQLRVRSAAGEMVTLGALMKIRKSSGPTAVVRVNGYRTIIITAAPASGKTPAEVAARCVKLAQEVLPRGYRAMDLTGPSQ